MIDYVSMSQDVVRRAWYPLRDTRGIRDVLGVLLVEPLSCGVASCLFALPRTTGEHWNRNTLGRCECRPKRVGVRHAIWVDLYFDAGDAAFHRRAHA